MNKKSASALLLILLLLLTLTTACAGGNSGSESTAATDSASQAPVELTVWGRWEETTAQMSETIAEFEAQYPGIKVNYTNVPGAQYVAQVQAAISGGTLPDLFGYHPSLQTSLLSNLGVLHSLDDVLTAEEKQQYYEGSWSEGYTLMNGVTYAFPLFNPMRPSYVMYYNKSALKSAGLTEEDLPQTWSELYDFSRKVKQNTDGQIYGLVIGVKATSFLSGVISQMATAVKPEVSPADSFNYLTGQYEYNSPGIVQGLELFKQLQDEQLLHPSSLVMTYREGTSLMEEGQAVLTMDGSFLASQLNREKQENYGVAPLPTLNGQAQYAAFQGESRVALYVSETTRHYEESKLFLQFLKGHYYSKIVRDGIEYSPVPAINEQIHVDNPVAEQALKIQDNSFKLIPRPFERNADALKVVVETSGKMPKLTLSDIAEGYLSGQIKDVHLELTQLTGEANAVFQKAIEKVNADGGNISAADYQFADWQPFTPYR